jgi:endo-1,4-beta-mannosidase
MTLKNLRLTGLIALAAFIISSCQKPSLGLSVHDGRFFHEGRPLRAVGVNYYDLFTRLAAKPQDTSSLQGLKTLASLGVPFVRFNAGGYSGKDWERYRADPEVHFVAMDRVVREAERLGIGLIPSVFWSSALNEAVGERRQSWGDPASETLEQMRDYTQRLVSRYKDSPAIWAWEFGNEWNLKMDLPNAAQLRKPGQDERDDLTSEQVLLALREFSAGVRNIDPSRPLITGHSHPRAAAWHNTHEKSWKADTREQWREIMLRDNAGGYDTLGIHIYADKEVNAECGRWATGWMDFLAALREVADETQRPIFIGEFGLGDGGEHAPEEVRRRFKEVMDAMEQNGIDLAAVWVYDLKNQTGNWNITPDNERAYMLQEVIEANRRWSKK